MKKGVLLLVVFLLSLRCIAGHIAGGEMYYTYTGPGSLPNTNKYLITLRLFRECHPVGTAALLPDDVIIGVFHNSIPSTLLRTIDVKRTTFNTLSLQQKLSCIINPPDICYQVATYSFTQELAADEDGYTFSYQTCCRSNSILNVEFFPLVTGQPGEGATYVCQIPGTNILGSGSHNSSAVFNLKDTVLICKNANITIDFSATDPDGDSLSYSFCSAYNRGNAIDSRNITPSYPPYQNVTYNAGYSGSEPMGGSIKINPVTGIITGAAPAVGAYVVNVCVTEYRRGNPISIHRKDFMIRVGDCDFAAAQLQPSYITCDGFSLMFENESTSAGIHSYYWDFGDTSSSHVSTDPTPTHTYTDSGTYNVKLVINRGEQCSDSAITKALIYPGFIPDFKMEGSCFLHPYQFSDLTTTKYGIVDSWRWDFGDPAVSSDTTTQQNAEYQYQTPGTVNVQLIVTNSKGCKDSVSKQLIVYDKPLIQLPFRDTLICNIDTLQLHASSGTNSATYHWSPSSNITDTSISDPYVFPKDTAIYSVTVNDQGCINTDSVKVNVISKVSIDAGEDTTVCKTDAIELLPISNALYFKWSPPTGLNDANIKNPLASPLNNIQYRVTGAVGKCSASDIKNIKVVPYPIADAGTDVSICYGQTTTLHATIHASAFAWSPSTSLLDANSLSPVAGPQSTTAYVLTVTDVLGCPKPVSDTIVVNVIPEVQAFAGNDTTIVIGQPLQLKASGGDMYQWSPATGIDNPNIFDPVVILGSKYDSIVYRVKVTTLEGCYGYDDIKVIVFKTKPDIFVPSAFTPNNDELNDILRPKLAGIKQFNYFRVFNRWGVMMFNTSEQNTGWDGTYNGTAQPSGTYVFIAQAIDYSGKLLTRKGTVVLIR